MDQPDLFSVPAPPTLPYQRTSRTSKAAAVQAVRFSQSQRSRILTWLTAQGEQGGTQIEARAALKLDAQSVCPRFWQLEKDEVIRKTAIDRGGATVYRLNKE